MNNLKLLVQIILIFIIVVLTFTPAVGYFPIFRRTWMYLLLGVAMLYPFTRKFFTSQKFFWLIISAIVMFLNVLSKDCYYSGSPRVFSEISILVLVTLMTQYAIQEGNKNLFLKWIIFTFFTIVVIETIASFILDQQMPGAIRALFSESIQTGERNELLYPYYRLGLSNYILPHAMPMLIPPLVMGFREKSNPLMIRIWSLFFLIFALELVWLSGAMTAFLMAILFLLLSIYTSFSKSPSMKLFILFGLLFLPFIFSDELKLYVLQISQDIFSGNDYIYRKLLLLEENVIFDEATGDVAERQNLYLGSINEFFKNIFIGTNNPMGNHSAFLDRLGTLGLVGFVPYIFFYYLQLKSIRFYIPKSRRIYYDLAIVAGLLMMSLKDVDSWELFFTLFTVMPLLLLYLSPNQTAKQ